MGSGDWFKAIIGRKNKQNKPKLLKPASQLPNGVKSTKRKSNGPSFIDPGVSGIAVEDLAATRIQAAFRRYKARKTLRYMKGIQRLGIVGQTNPVKKQTSTTLSYIQSWNRLQAEIRTRRAFMVTEGRNRQKKQENQLKLDAKLHDLQVEWNGGSETMEEILARIQQREEAAVKRERAMAYAFSHQWRARSGNCQGPFNYEVGKGGWAWSWMDRWIASRPWEPRHLIHPENTKKGQAKTGSKSSTSTNQSALKLAGAISLSTIDDRKGSIKKPSMPVHEKKVAKEPKPKAATSSKLKSKNSAANHEKHLPSQNVSNH